MKSFRLSFRNFGDRILAITGWTSRVFLKNVDGFCFTAPQASMEPENGARRGLTAKAQTQTTVWKNPTFRFAIRTGYGDDVLGIRHWS